MSSKVALDSLYFVLKLVSFVYFLNCILKVLQVFYLISSVNNIIYLLEIIGSNSKKSSQPYSYLFSRIDINLPLYIVSSLKL